ncbi:D-alanyl-D-alanine carboxypeptidase family protein [Paenibacillus sp. JX-17]|uniref:D-alanyl-D-alanine carboxypeptidase family protein n=2 Tax=Paenibacillus lacisoli TaxID=3064525 RepID=A0ABT9C8W2_9BACL|nr:D-alanyl-D-alanine carboxypeptidase family protein [Paenibacillus sp. JX-17]MDO7905109.1 D-alanyl-D-alanine carboxypeptidase family protein [Paenibacillus sp. JX-17]
MAAGLVPSVSAANAETVPVPPGISTHAQASALIDVTSGRILYSSHGDEELRIASLTKIMTALVAIEQGRLDDKVKVSARAFAKEGSSIYLKLGEEMTLENMLYGLMLRSGNDAATAIAEHIGGSEDGFVFLMNQKAEELGLSHSHFMNPHGLDAEGHYSSANDLAKLTAYALQQPEFKKIVATKEKAAPNPNESWDYKWANKNKLLRLYEGADGVKTGYTKKAFRCLVSSATRHGQQLAAVTLNDGDDWKDHARMLDYGFKYYPLVTLAEKEMRVHEQPLQTGKAFVYPLAEGEKGQVTNKLVLYPPVRPGKLDSSFGIRGSVDFYLHDRRIGSVPIYHRSEANSNGGSSGTASPAAPSSGTMHTNSPVWLSVWKRVMSHLF